VVTQKGVHKSSRGKNTMQEKETLDERLPGLFEPDTLLPVQYFDAMRRKHLLEGEKRLVLSVLEDAIECYMKYLGSTSSKGQKLFRDAEEWINLEDKRWVFSFDNVCEMLDINPEYMRRGLRMWKERRLQQLAEQERKTASGSVERQPSAPTQETAQTQPSRPKSARRAVAKTRKTAKAAHLQEARA